MSHSVKNNQAESTGNEIGAGAPKTGSKRSEFKGAPIALPTELLMTPPEQPHRPWLVPGRGSL